MNHIASPDSTDPGIERQILDKGLTAPRITPADLKANIAAVIYFTAFDGASHVVLEDPYKAEVPTPEVAQALKLLTFCTLVLKNGFMVTGESACASPENFDADIGKQIARQNAEQKIWPLMGYKLKEDLFQRTAPLEMPV